jgi:hypothetical protein
MLLVSMHAWFCRGKVNRPLTVTSPGAGVTGSPSSWV